MSGGSRFLSLILRHKPEEIGLTLDPQGWADIDTLLSKMKAAGKPFSRDALMEFVASNEKKRFTLSDDGTRIRAAQGHSVPVDLGLTEKTPPEVLYHGTATKTLDAIMRDGLTPQSRQQVHLSADTQTAIAVGQRHGKPVVLSIAAGAMSMNGMTFYQADNGVWLTDQVPTAYITFKS
jgi:putative RNA 2'-phosphotransferase